MKSLHILIIEDEIPAARLLRDMVSTLRPEWQVELGPGSVDEAAEWFNTHAAPDLLFLDIHLSDGDAFDFLQTVRPPCAVVFTTAYDQYALRAFSVNSIDYILKPFDEQRLAETIAKFERLCTKKWRNNSEVYLEFLMDALKKQEKKYRNRFLIARGDVLRSLQTDRIAYFYSEEKLTFAVTPDGKEHIIDLSLNKLEEQLNPEQFFRLNRQMIVNIDAIDHASLFYKGKMKVKVVPAFKTDIVVSERKAAAFRLWLNY